MTAALPRFLGSFEELLLKRCAVGIEEERKKYSRAFDENRGHLDMLSAGQKMMIENLNDVMISPESRERCSYICVE